MVVHIAECVLGVFAFDDDGRMLASKQFPQDAVEVAGRLASVQMGTPTEEHRELISKLIEEGSRKFTLESELLVEKLREEFRRAKFKVQLPNRAGELLRTKLKEIAKEVGFEEVEVGAQEGRSMFGVLRISASVGRVAFCPGDQNIWRVPTANAGVPGSQGSALALVRYLRIGLPESLELGWVLLVAFAQSYIGSYILRGHM